MTDIGLKKPTIYRKLEWGQDNQQLPHKASILQVLNWRVGNTTNKAHYQGTFYLFLIYYFIIIFLNINVFINTFCTTFIC